MKKFEVRFLSKKEMTNAKEIDPRYEGVDDDNLGFCDPEKNRIFVLASKDAELMKYLVGHEMEHLLEDEGTHEDEQGIRHKKGGIFHNLVNTFFPFIGPAIQGDRAVFKTSLENLGNQAVGATEGYLGSGGNPLGAAGGALNSGISGSGPFGQKQASYQGDQSQGAFNNLFQNPITQASQQSLGQGYGQQGSFAPSSQGYSGGGGAMGLFNGGLGQAGITLGNQSMQGGDKTPGQQQNQSGYFFPSYKF